MIIYKKDTAINNFQIMIDTIIKGGKTNHPYLVFLRDGIEIINKQDELLKEQEVNVRQCFQTSLMFKAQSNQSNKKLLESEKKVLSLESRVKELEELNEKLKDGL